MSIDQEWMDNVQEQEAHEMTLTKEQAIKRIIDIRKGLSCDHHGGASDQTIVCRAAAVSELMAIFDISNDDISDLILSL